MKKIPISHQEILSLRKQMAFFRLKKSPKIWFTLHTVNYYDETTVFYGLSGKHCSYSELVEQHEYTLDDGITWLSMMKSVPN